MFVCEYCNTKLTSKSNLKIHQNKTKYCLDIQNKINPNICVSSNEKCKNCNDLEKVVLLLKEEINNLKLQNEKEKVEIYSSLFNKDQDYILSQSMRGNITNNSYKAKTMTLNTLDLSAERIEAVKDTYTLQDYEKGGAGQADWLHDNLLKDKYICTDRTRNIFAFKNSDNEIEHDVRAKKLKGLFQPILASKINDYKRQKCIEMAEEEDDDNEIAGKNSELYRDNKNLSKSFDDRLVEKTYIKTLPPLN